MQEKEKCSGWNVIRMVKNRSRLDAISGQKKLIKGAGEILLTCKD
jgi:hypothetical protein